MKKLLPALIAILISGVSFAQSLTLSWSEGEITNGSKVTVMGDPSDELIRIEINVTNVTGSALDVKAKKVIGEGDTIALTENSFCWGVCYPPFVYESPFPVTIGAGETYPDFDGDYNPKGHPGKSEIMYVFFLDANPSDSISVIVEYNASAVGLSENQDSRANLAAYPNPAREFVNFDYRLPEGITSGQLVITNLLGAKVNEISLDKASGRIEVPVTDLINGIYFYTLMTGNQLMATSKLVVKH
jgi:hypothetical protein